MDLSPLRRLSERTLDVFTAAMADEAGVSRSSLSRLRSEGTIGVVSGRGLMFGTARPTLEQQAVAACLTWPDAVVCFRTAARLHRFPIDDDGVVHVLVPNGRKAFGGLHCHHWSVGPTGVEIRDGIRMTDRRTTLADCLGRLPDAEAWGLLAWLWTRDLITIDDVEAQVADRSHLYGVVRLREMVAALRRGAVSPAEISLQDFLTNHGFTGWLPDQRIFRDGRIVARVDVLFANERVILEYDGRLAHPTRLSARDARRQQLLRRLGYHTIRVRWERLTEDGRALANEIREALAAAA